MDQPSWRSSRDTIPRSSSAPHWRATARSPLSNVTPADDEAGDRSDAASSASDPTQQQQRDDNSKSPPRQRRRANRAKPLPFPSSPPSPAGSLQAIAQRNSWRRSRSESPFNSNSAAPPPPLQEADEGTGAASPPTDPAVQAVFLTNARFIARPHGLASAEEQGAVAQFLDAERQRALLRGTVRRVEAAGCGGYCHADWSAVRYRLLRAAPVPVDDADMQRPPARKPESEELADPLDYRYAVLAAAVLCLAASAVEQWLVVAEAERQLNAVRMLFVDVLDAYCEAWFKRGEIGTGERKGWCDWEVLALRREGRLR